MKLDHDNARMLAQGMVALGFKLSIPHETNMVWIDSSNLQVSVPSQDGSMVIRDLHMDDLKLFVEPRGICMSGGQVTSGRLVIHHQIDREGINFFLKCMNDMFAELKVTVKNQ